MGPGGRLWDVATDGLTIAPFSVLYLSSIDIHSSCVLWYNVCVHSNVLCSYSAHTIQVAMCVGIPMFIVFTVIMVMKLSGARGPNSPMNGGPNYGSITQSPVSTVTDDVGTTTDL